MIKVFVFSTSLALAMITPAAAKPASEEVQPGMIERPIPKPAAAGNAATPAVSGASTSTMVGARVSANAAPTTPTQYVDNFLGGKTSRERLSTSTVDMIMMHFCSDVIQNPDNPYQVTRIKDIFTSYGVSAHYLVDREGTVHRFVPEERVAFHAGKGRLSWMPERTNQLNEHAIGIEILNVGSWRDMKTFMKKEAYDEFASKYPNWIGYTDAQYAALRKLVEDIRSRHPIPFDRYHIIGHEEYAGAGRRTDPGELFDWTRIGLPMTRPDDRGTTATAGPASTPVGASADAGTTPPAVMPPARFGPSAGTTNTVTSR